MAGLKLVCFAVVCMVLASTAVDANVSCGQVVSFLGPCIPYARGTAPGYPPTCCSGIRNLNNAAASTTDRQTACRCMKTAASGIRGLKYDVIASLPGKCGVTIPYKLSPDTDCNKVK